MTLGELKQHFEDGEYSDGLHIVMVDTSVGNRVEIDDVWVDGDGHLCIVSGGRSCGDMDDDLVGEVFGNDDEDEDDAEEADES